MVREPGADDLRTLGGRSVKCIRTTIHSPRHVDGPYLVLAPSNWCRADSLPSPSGQSGPHADGLVSLRGRSGIPTRTVRQTPSGQKLLEKRIKTKALKNTRRTQITLSQKAPRGLSATYRWTVRQAQTEQPELQTASTTSPTRPWISQTS
jgi:hypothetical protein